MSESRDVIVRHTPGERTNHWLLAISFVLAALSGLSMFHPALFWLDNLFGGGTWTRILHPFIAVFAAISFMFLAALVWDDNRMQPADWQWLRRWRDVVDNREENLPEVGRYNGGQKLLFVLMVICMAGLVLSGFVIWRAYFSFPVAVVRLAAVTHAVCACVLICGILVHIYAAIWIKGSVHAMLRGTVTPGWAWRHHRAWFRQVTHATHPRPGRD